MYKVYGTTNVGRIREHNEDSFLVNGIIYSKGSIYLENINEIFVAIADGMGGSECGEVASKFILNEIKSSISNFDEEEVKEEINIINKRLLEAPNQKIGKKGMGSTLVAFKAIGEKNILINIGDSRGYLYRSGFIRQITKDQTLVQQLSELGAIGIDEKKNIVNHIY